DRGEKEGQNEGKDPQGESHQSLVRPFYEQGDERRHTHKSLLDRGLHQPAIPQDRVNRAGFALRNLWGGRDIPSIRDIVSTRREIMAFDTTQARMGGREHFTPMQIAHNALFTAKEKLDLLHQIKAEVSGAVQNEDDLGFSPQEVD